MKKTIALLMSCLVLVGLFSACGAQDSGETTVDLEAFYEQVTGEHELAAMEDLDCWRTTIPASPATPSSSASPRPR